jgi:hypothetical protein
MFGRGKLSSTAKLALEITRRTCADGRSRELIAAMLYSEGDEAELTDADVLVCRWPNETALAVAETFYVDAAPLTRLRLEHVRSEWAAIAAYGRVQNALLIALRSEVTAPRYERAMRYSRASYGKDPRFLETLKLARADLEETMASGIREPVAAYATAIYMRSVLAEEHVGTYFTAQAAEDAVDQVAVVIRSALGQLVGMG